MCWYKETSQLGVCHISVCAKARYGRDARKADDMKGENRARGETREARNVGKEECGKKLWRSLFLPPSLAFVSS